MVTQIKDELNPFDDFLYSDEDFLSSFSKLKPYRDKFNLYSDKIVIEYSTGFSGDSPSSPIIAFIPRIYIKDIVVKKSLLGFSYKVYIEIDYKENVVGASFKPGLVLLISSLSKEKAEKLKKILLDIKCGTCVRDHHIRQHKESILYKDWSYQKRIEETTKIFEKYILTVLKVGVIVFSILASIFLLLVINS